MVVGALAGAAGVAEVTGAAAEAADVKWWMSVIQRLQEQWIDFEGIVTLSSSVQIAGETARKKQYLFRPLLIVNCKLADCQGSVREALSSKHCTLTTHLQTARPES